MYMFMYIHTPAHKREFEFTENERIHAQTTLVSVFLLKMCTSFKYFTIKFNHNNEKREKNTLFSFITNPKQLPLK